MRSTAGTAVCRSPSSRWRRRLVRWVLGAAVVVASIVSWVVLPMPWAAAAGAAAAPGLVVSSPAGPVQAVPGTAVGTAIRVGNSSGSPMHVVLAQGRVSFGDNGRATVSDGSDPLWPGRVQLATTELTVPAGGYRQIPITVSLPAGTAPDDYFLGLLVTPTPTGSGTVKVLTRLAALIDFEVPGPRHSDIRIIAQHVPGVLWGAQLTVRTVVANEASSFATVWGEVHYHSLWSGTHVVAFPGRYLIAPGHRRTLQASIRLGAGLGPVHIDSIVFYNATPHSVASQHRAATTWLINPPYLPAVPVALAATVIWLLARRRNRTRRRASTGPRSGRHRPVVTTHRERKGAMQQ